MSRPERIAWSDFTVKLPVPNFAALTDPGAERAIAYDETKNDGSYFVYLDGAWRPESMPVTQVIRAARLAAFGG